MTYRRLIRIALGYLALSSAQIGVWALVAPRSFYDNFPGLGRTWISIDGPYNEHLIRDVGALNLALVVLLVSAAVSLSRPLVITAALSALTWGVPHVIYHIANTDGLETGDIVASVGGLAFFAALPIGLIVLSGRIEGDPAAAPR